MNRGSPRPPRGFFTPNNRQQPNQDDQRNTVNIPFYRDTTSRDNYNRNFGGPSPRHFQPHHNNNFHQRRGGGPRFNNNNSYTPRNNRPHFQQGGGGRGREAIDISQFYHPSMLQDPWAGLGEDRESDRERFRREAASQKAAGGE